MDPAKKTKQSAIVKQARSTARAYGKSYRKFLNTYVKNRTFRRVERFVFSWFLIFVLCAFWTFYHMERLEDHYLSYTPASGGQYMEGIVGEIGSLNPIYSDGQVSEAAVRLIFSGLMRTDNPFGPSMDLAESYVINEEQTVYTVSLRDDIFWHDGQPVTAHDVAFTIDLIQNPDVGSHLQIDWRDIDVEVLDDLTVEFTLPNPYAPFLYQLGTGILPRHILRDIDIERLRVASFNQRPVGSGPFMFEDITGNQIRMRANESYHLGAPRLERLSIVTFELEEDMVSSYNRGELGGMVFGAAFDIDQLNEVNKSQVSRVDVASQVFAFYNNETVNSRDLRQALTQSINTLELRGHLGNDYRYADSPLLPSQIGYIPSQLQYNPEEAVSKFEEAGWEMSENRLLKGDEQLRLRLVTQDSHSYPRAAEKVRQQLEQAGVAIDLIVVPGVELQEEYLRPRDFDILLFGIEIDKDPDVYAYWHSSQARDPGRNVSQYKSDVADTNLEDGRTRTDEDIRAAKYEVFQRQWRRDAPAAALYRLHNYYVNRHELDGVNLTDISQPVDRFYNVTSWTIQTEQVLDRLQP